MSNCERFHQETKYAPETIHDLPAPVPGEEPKSFKEFHSKERLDLKPHLLLRRDPVTKEPVLQVDDVTGSLDIARISTLLLHTNGVTAYARDQAGAVHRFRAAPSAGARYPTEIYLAVHDVEGLDDGIYNYQSESHSLVPMIEGDFRGDLHHATFEHPACQRARCVVLMTGVFRRSSWRYHDRGYRRALLDTGHVLGNLTMFAPELGLATCPIGGFDDEALASLLLLDSNEESMLLLGAIIDDQRSTPYDSAYGSPARTDRGNEDGDLIGTTHRAGNIDARTAKSPPERNDDRVRSASRRLETLPTEGFAWNGRLSETIIARRSTRAFSGAPIPREELGSLLGEAYRHARSGAGPAGPGVPSFFTADRLETWIAAPRITGLDAGLYRYDPSTSNLHLLRHGALEGRLTNICLGQPLASSAAAIIFHVADLPDVVTDYGDRGYRYLGIDAGHIGQHMNLAAIRMGLGVSGIGGYFDDDVNELFSLPPWAAIIYVTVLGQPLKPTE